jgi:RND family efflux transporter MFP subunit
MEQETIVAGRILADMSDGVMTINLAGQIITFNPAASRILGIRQEDALEKNFGELFLLAEENDDFNQTILDAIYESSISHNRIVPFSHNGQQSILSLTTTFLQAEDGTGQRMGVIAVFNDITELQTLQETEARQAAELKENHYQLQDAYLKTEQSNEQLQAALKKVQVIRNTATIFSIILFLAIGLFVWNRKPYSVTMPPPSADQAAITTTIPVTPQPVSTSISLTGKLQPLQMVNLTSPLTGKVAQVMVRYGEIVKAGQSLVAMDTSEAQIKYREAKAAYIKALTNFRQMEKWNSGAEVTRASRSLTKAKMSLESQKKTVDETERLFKKGIIPATEYESAKQQYANQKLDFQTAEEELKAAHEKGNDDSQKVARFEMENAEARMKQAEHDMSSALIVAPVGGIVIKPTATGQSKEGKTAERGASFQQGEVLLAIGDLTGYSVNCKVDEIDVTKVTLGQKVRVSGDAFPGEQLNGVIQSISPQAEEGDASKGTTSFGIRVVIDSVSPELRKRIMVGMTANLEIIIYEKPDALMVPLSAVKEENGKRYLIRKKGETLEKVEVTTGYTTQDTVEITKGLKPGEMIEVAGAPLTAVSGGKQ